MLDFSLIILHLNRSNLAPDVLYHFDEIRINEVTVVISHAVPFGDTSHLSISDFLIQANGSLVQMPDMQVNPSQTELSTFRL